MTSGSARHQPATKSVRREPWRRPLTCLLAGLLLAATAVPASAVVAMSPGIRRDTSELRGAVELARKDFTAPAKPPARGSSADLYGGSSADRYGGSSADRSGVAGRRDIRNRGVHQNRRRDGGTRRSQSRNQEQADEQDEREEDDQR